MQYLAIRNGRQHWVTDNEPSPEAIDAALLVTLASRLGYDWQEAADTLEQETCHEERDEAHAIADSYSDEQLVRAVAAMMAHRRREMERRRAAWAAKLAATDAVGAFIVQVLA